MIGIDFTWGNFREDPTSSLAVFTCDLLVPIHSNKKCFGSVSKHFRFMVLVALA